MRLALAEQRRAQQRAQQSRAPPPQRRAPGRAARPARLRRPVRRRLQPDHPDRPDSRCGGGSEQPMTTTMTTHHRPRQHRPADGLPSMLAYLTRVLKTPTIGALLGRARRPGPRRELVARGVPGRGPATPGRRPRVRRHHDADPHRALPGGQDARGLQPRPPALAAPRRAGAPGDRHVRREGRERDPARPTRAREDPPRDRARGQSRPRRLLGAVRHREQLDHPPRRAPTRPGDSRPS